MIHEQNYFDQSAKNNLTTYDSIRKITTGYDYYYTSGCVLDNFYMKEHYKTITRDLSNQ